MGRVGRVFLLLAASAVAGEAGGAIEFAAMTQIGADRRFVLQDDRGPSDWLRVGQSFDGYAIVSFDPTQEMLAVRRGDQLLQLPLKGSHVQAMTGPPVSDVLAGAGITPADLVVRDSEPVRITLVVEGSPAPLPERIIDVQFKYPGGTAGVALGRTGRRPSAAPTSPKRFAMA